jgi:hypothetical protein
VADQQQLALAAALPARDDDIANHAASGFHPLHAAPARAQFGVQIAGHGSHALGIAGAGLDLDEALQGAGDGRGFCGGGGEQGGIGLGRRQYWRGKQGQSGQHQAHHRVSSNNSRPIR